MIVLGLHRLALDLDLLAGGTLSERVRLLNTPYISTCALNHAIGQYTCT